MSYVHSSSHSGDVNHFFKFCKPYQVLSYVAHKFFLMPYCYFNWLAQEKNLCFNLPKAVSLKMPTDPCPASFCMSLSHQFACCINIMLKLPVNHRKGVHVSAQSCKLSAQWKAEGSCSWDTGAGKVWVADTWVCLSHAGCNLHSAHI